MSVTYMESTANQRPFELNISALIVLYSISCKDSRMAVRNFRICSVTFIFEHSQYHNLVHY